MQSFYYFPGWVGGWVAVLIENKANSAFNKVEVEFEVEAELGNIYFTTDCILVPSLAIIDDLVSKHQ